MSRPSRSSQPWVTPDSQRHLSCEWWQYRDWWSWLCGAAVRRYKYSWEWWHISWWVPQMGNGIKQSWHRWCHFCGAMDGTISQVCLEYESSQFLTLVSFDVNGDGLISPEEMHEQKWSMLGWIVLTILPILECLVAWRTGHLGRQQLWCNDLGLVKFIWQEYGTNLSTAARTWLIQGSQNRSGSG